MSNMQWQSRPGGDAAHPFQHHRQHPANSNIIRIPPTESYSRGEPKNAHVQGSRYNLFQVWQTEHGAFWFAVIPLCERTMCEIHLHSSCMSPRNAQSVVKSDLFEWPLFPRAPWETARGTVLFFCAQSWDYVCEIRQKKDCIDGEGVGFLCDRARVLHFPWGFLPF